MSSLADVAEFVMGQHPLVAALLVGSFVSLTAIVINVSTQLLLPTSPNLPPLVFHWFPLIGSTISYGMNPVAFLASCREKYGDVFTFVLAGRKVTVALGAKGNDLVLGARTSHVSAEQAYHPLTTPVFGKGVAYDIPNAQLMEQKRFMKFGLTTDKFRHYTSLISEEVSKFLVSHPSFSTVAPGQWGSFDTYKTVSELIIYTATRTLQGDEVRKAVDGSFADLYHDLDGGFKAINLLLPSLPLPMNIRRDRAQKKMSDFYVRIQQQRKSGQHEEGNDMISALMEQRYKDGRPLSVREISHIMIALLMAGQHTSASTATWALLHLASRLDVWEQLYEEQMNYFANADGTFRDIQYEDLRDLPILDSVIRETLRLHPPIHSILRYVTKDLPVPSTLSSSAPYIIKKHSPSYIIPKGHLLLASPALSQVDPLVWKDAATWDPSRWLDPEGVASAARDAYENGKGEKVDYGFGAVSKGTESPYQPFGAGRHRCIGEQFAYVQMGTILSELVRRLEIKIDKVPAHNYTTLIVVPEQPDSISFRMRS